AESIYRKQLESIELSLQSLASKAVELVREDPGLAHTDPWLKQLNWAAAPPKSKKLPGFPQWYRDLYNSKSGKFKITPNCRITPLLLRLKWEGYPLFYSKTHGWTYRVPNNDDKYQTKAKPCKFDKPSNVETGDNLENASATKNYEEQFYNDDEGTYYRIPHKDGENARCMSPLSKNYITSFEEGILSSEYEEARSALQMNAACSYWVSSRKRIKNQMVVYQDHPEIKDIGFGLDNEKLVGIILPQTLAMGTVTRRAVENTWMTASNPKENRIGSELKAMIQPPKGYKIVGADVDLEELWISSLIGDSQFGFHGATAMGWMTLQGTKAAETDLHSRTAKILNISRSEAKIFNYGRIYGAGLKFAIQLLKQFNKDIETEEAKDLATELYFKTKGKRFESLWYGGSESYMFNRLEDIANDDLPKTPVLKCGITEALRSTRGFMTSRVNWVVQSSGVDYLHLLLVSVHYLLEKYKIDARFMLSVHDEVRFLVKEQDKERMVLALQISSLWTRAMFSYMLGIKDLPL
ncbi:18899_t:CDS:1, partial [Acaulospora morrowiae]